MQPDGFLELFAESRIAFLGLIEKPSVLRVEFPLLGR